MPQEQQGQSGQQQSHTTTVSPDTMFQSQSGDYELSWDEGSPNTLILRKSNDDSEVIDSFAIVND